jgi:cytochrome bd-type quinol oxidase subunit 1
MGKYKKLSDFDIEDIRNKINYKSKPKEEKIEKLKRKLHLTNRQASWLIDTKEREDLVEKLMRIENDEDEYAKSKIPFLLHYFDFKVLMIIGVIMIFFSILTLFIPGDSPKYNDSAVMLLGIIFGIGLVFYSLCLLLRSHYGVGYIGFGAYKCCYFCRHLLRIDNYKSY